MGAGEWIAFAMLAAVLVGGLIDIRVKLSKCLTSEQFESHRLRYDEELQDVREKIVWLESRVNRGAL